MENKNLARNAFLNGGQKFLSMIFPLITIPYISRVLLVDDIGKINISQSIISYFILLAGLGINNYATREGARLRDNEDELEKFANEVFSINIISTFISYCILIIFFIFSKKMKSYSTLIVIQSLMILGNTVGINWLYSIKEDYIYITIRTIIVQLLSLVLMFCCIFNEQDYIKYALITVVANVGGNVFNLIHSRKYLRLKFTLRINLKKHIKPILIIFSSTIAITIYVNSDITLLGWICGEQSVGLYSRSVRIYTIIKQMVAAMVIVGLPTLSNLIQKNNIRDYIISSNNIFKNIIMFSLPIGIGLSCTADSIIYIIAGQQYIDASKSLSILGVSSIFAVLSSFTTYCYMLPLKHEKVQMVGTYIGAMLNIGANLIILPKFSQNGAAFTTLISELVVLILQVVFIFKNKIFRKIFKITFIDFMALSIANLSIVLITIFINMFSLSLILDFIITVPSCIIIYCIILRQFKYKQFNDIYVFIIRTLNIRILKLRLKLKSTMKEN